MEYIHEYTEIFKAFNNSKALLRCEFLHQFILILNYGCVPVGTPTVILTIHLHPPTEQHLGIIL